MTTQAKKYIADFQELMKEWDWEANADLAPNKITYGSHKKAWWKCSKCGYKWQATIKQRTLSHTGCPACSGKILILGKNDLLTIRPDIAAQWHPFKNGSLRPQDVTYGWGKKVWWKCQNCGYEWQTTPNNRTRKSDNKCPCCVNKVVVKGKNDFATTHPELAKEWHPTKNGDLTPEKITYGCSKKVWWKCPHGHEYLSTSANRANGTNCPICNNGRKTSFAEQAFYYYIKQVFPDAINRYKAKFLGLMEFDIFIPSIKCAIEYDGKPWHSKGFKGKREREERKYNICIENNIHLIRVREGNIDNDANIADCQFELNNINNHKNLDKTIHNVLKYLTSKEDMKNKWSIDTERDRFKILDMMNVVQKNNSLAEMFPDIASEWHLTKNGNLKPQMFLPGSKVKVWWVCPICGNEYQQVINHRSIRGSGCPVCGIRKRSQSLRLSVQQIDMKSKQIIKTYDSVQAAAKDTKITPSNISMVCTGQRKTAGGYVWRYIEGKTNRKDRIAKPVCMISISTHKILKQFNSVREASQETGIYEGSIRKVCEGNRKSAHGYIWRYADEEEAKKHLRPKNQLEFDFDLVKD